MKTEIKKVGKVWVISGKYAVVAGKIVNEPFETVYRTEHEATYYARKIDENNVENLAYVAEVEAARRREVAAYLAKREARRSTEIQLSLI